MVRRLENTIRHCVRFGGFVSKRSWKGVSDGSFSYMGLVVFSMKRINSYRRKRKVMENNIHPKGAQGGIQIAV